MVDWWTKFQHRTENGCLRLNMKIIADEKLQPVANTLQIIGIALIAQDL